MLKKICLIIGVIVFTSIGLLAFEFSSVGQNIFQLGEEKSIFEALRKLTLSEDSPLKGEKEGRINILLLGKGGAEHEGGDLTDTIVLASLKPQTKEAVLLSIPRDLYVRNHDSEYYSKINALKLYGDQEENGSGLPLLKKTVANITGLPIHYYILLDFEGFKQIIDGLGGISLYIEKDIFDPSFPGPGYSFETFSLEKGWHWLDGEKTLKYVRSRHSPGGDFNRTRRQQQVLEAIRLKVFSLRGLLDIRTLYKILSALEGHLETDIKIYEVKRFYEIAKGIDPTRIINEVIESGENGLLEQKEISSGGSVLIPKKGIDDFSQIRELVKNIFKQ